QENLGTGVNEFLLPEPADGEYEIKISGGQNAIYEINISSFKENGNDYLNKIKGIVSDNNDETLEIDYSQNQTSEIKRSVSSQDLINDLNELKNLGLFKNNGIYNSLLAKIPIAQLSASVNKKTSINILNALFNEVKAQRGKGITEEAYQILIYDLNYLKNN
ncbi:MAG: hypothetical protein AAB609_03670, partial [Patescibacteria group bacterium]